jgi:hypothetical protein
MTQQLPFIIEVKIHHIEHLPTEVSYMASIDNEKYKMAVVADSIANCFKELSISILVADEYEKQKIK